MRSAIFRMIRHGSIATASSCQPVMVACSSTVGYISPGMMSRSTTSRTSGSCTAKLPVIRNSAIRPESKRPRAPWDKESETPSEWRSLRRWLKPGLTPKNIRFLITRLSVWRGTAVLQEGVAAEAAAFAGHQKLDNLILIYDSNDVTLDAMAKMSQSEDTAERFRAYEFEVQTVDGHDMEAFLAAFEKAKTAASGKPQFIVSRTVIGKGIPEVAGTNKAHGEAGVKYVDAARKGLGLPDEKFFVSKEVREFFASHRQSLKKRYLDWQEKFNAWKSANADLAKLLDGRNHPETAQDLLAHIPAFPSDSKIATRKAGSDVLQPVAKAVPLLIGGSADLYGSTLNYIQSDKDFNPENRAGRNIRFGIREHGMCAIMNGIAYHGIFRPSGATFLVFADYCRAFNSAGRAREATRDLHFYARFCRSRRGRSYT